MKPVNVFLFASAVALAYFPVSAAAFGFGGTKQEYPYGPYGPYGGYPPQGATPQGYAPPRGYAPPQGYAPPYSGPRGPNPYGPPPNARDIKGVWGSGPGLTWGSRDKEEKMERPRPNWKWTKDWDYESPYKNAPPWVSPYAAPPPGPKPSK